MEYSKDYDILPESIKNILGDLVKKVEPKEILLFGSRARGDHRKNSDYDIAVKGVAAKMDAWNEFLVNLEEDINTLFAIDLVEYETLDNKYKQNIDHDGVVLYG